MYNGHYLLIIFILAVLTDPVTDVDKVLLHLEAKEFTVEPSTLQSLQQLIQWIADLTLNLLARLPEQRANSNKSSGVVKFYTALYILYFAVAVKIACLIF